MSPPSALQRKAAEEVKAEGNALFARGKYAAAAERYTEAIVLAPDLAVLYTNRAMSLKRLGGRWEQVAKDAARALELSRDSVKGHYLLGVARRELGDLPCAVQHLSKALEAARETGDAIRDELWHELARTKYALWQRESAARRERDAALRAELEAMLSAQRLRGCVSGAAAVAAEAAAASAGAAAGADKGGPAAARGTEGQAAWDDLLRRAAHLDRPEEVPSCLVCPLTMSVFREPVITPSGFSYEHSALLEHLDKVGAFDPISRQPLSKDDLVVNVGLRNATRQYLDEHGWSWAECT